MPYKGTSMSPKIDPIQSLLPATNGHMAITGPIGPWDDDAVAVVFTVVVSQIIGNTMPNTPIATAIGWSGEYTTGGPGAKWSATTRLIGATALQLGGATVAAWATIADKDGGSEIYEWTLPVKFV
jgi:hypothetical protein